MWLEAQLEELHLKSDSRMQLMIYIESSINLAKNPVAYERSKNIETQFHFSRDQGNKGKLTGIFRLEGEKHKGIVVPTFPTATTS